MKKGGDTGSAKICIHSAVREWSSFPGNGFLTSGLCLLLLAFFCSCSSAPETTLRKYEQAHNAHDVSKELSCYSPEVVFEIQDVWTKSGLVQMHELAEWDSTLNSNLNFELLERYGDTLLCRVVESNDWFRAVGMEYVVHDSVWLVVEDEKIKYIKAIPNSQQSKAVAEIMQSLFQWSSETGDTILPTLFKGQEFIYSEEAAQKWLDLLATWQKR